jgi:hypothetical protein
VERWTTRHNPTLLGFQPGLPQEARAKSRTSSRAGKRKVPLGPAPGPQRDTVAQAPVRLNGLAWIRVNDPSAGSPTETLLRLLLPLSDKVHETSRCDPRKPRIAAVRIIHRITQSVGATGGVYKGQGRNQHELMTRTY